jgi:hypothetical protein
MGWTIVESGMYLTAACLPFFRPIFGLVFKSMATTKANTYQIDSRELKSSTRRTATTRSGFEKFDAPEGKRCDLEEVCDGPSNLDTELVMSAARGSPIL